MPKPPTAMEAEARNLETPFQKLPQFSAPTQSRSARSPNSSPQLHSLERSPLKEVHQSQLLEPEAVTAYIRPCPQCNSTQEIKTAGAGPHYAALRCANCDRFIKWLRKSKPAGGVS